MQVLVIAAGGAVGHAVVALGSGALEHVVDQSAGAGRTIEEAGQTAEDFQPLHFLDEVAAIVAVAEAQAVIGNTQVADAAEAANGHCACVAGAGRGGELRGGAELEDVVAGGGLDVVHQLRRNHGYRIGRILKRHSTQRTDVLHGTGAVAAFFAAVCRRLGCHHGHIR